MKHNYVTIENPINATPDIRNIPMGEFLDSTETAKASADAGLLKETSEFVVRDLFMEKFSIRHVQGEFTHDIVARTMQSSVSTTVESCVYLQGTTQTLDDKLEGGVRLEKGDQNFIFDPWRDYVHRTNAHQPFYYLHFIVDKEYFTNLLPEEERWSDDLKFKILSNEIVLGTPHSLTHPLQHQAIHNIMTNPLSGSLGKMFIEASFQQFVVFHLKSLFQPGDSEETGKISKRDRDLMVAVRDHLDKRFTEDHSLVSLARSFGINETKLMKCFKHEFGLTVFEYISDLKMAHARKLIEDQGMFVAEVAAIIGYKNPNHFSSAFKNKYGFSPSKLKR